MTSNITRRLVGVAITVSSLAQGANVLAFDSNVPTTGLPNAGVYSSIVLPERVGVVSWKTLSKVESVVEGGKVVARFDPAIAELDRTIVTVQGFMLPMDLGDQQHHFLISAVPPHCPFCLPAGPDAIMEVKAKTGVAFAMEPVLLTGKFVLVKDDSYGLLYQLVDAAPLAKQVR